MSKLDILHVGGVHKSRAHIVTLTAMDIIREENPEAKLIVAGKIQPALVWWVDKFIWGNPQTRGSILLTGRVKYDRVLKLISGADICLCPLSNIEIKRCTYPIKIYEYLAMGKPVVATRLPGIEQIINHGENGLLVAPDDPKAMADAVLMIHQDPELKTRLEKNARASVVKYDWGIINQQIGKALEDLIKV